MRMIPCLPALVVAFASISTQVLAADPVKMGVISCTVTGSDNSFFSDELSLACEFKNENGDRATEYTGAIDREGITLGDVSAQRMTWVVLSLGEPDEIKIAGTYFGADAGISAGQGVGADYLVGGFNRSIALQPYAVESDSGLGLSLSGQKLVLAKK